MNLTRIQVPLLPVKVRFFFGGKGVGALRWIETPDDMDN